MKIMPTIQKIENVTQDDTSDLNYSFLVKIFSKLSATSKSKVLQILKNTSDLKETG